MGRLRIAFFTLEGMYWIGLNGCCWVFMLLYCGFWSRFFFFRFLVLSSRVVISYTTVMCESRRRVHRIRIVR
ncbi:hypothetical protein BDV27DRAFT_127074 [Aspergillus caelatus]|uniref:Uncharacterized protein n=1 Tax=Aspergillus caelatus TaxID=61420 RepID=A0A5N7A784_9EURO|nr:uncharacterized protein BDV27DRAFT_127074 [Aspergillus caelatus]KAE8365298.1 hypothetical protein BDV27DRAFT_127074 [Aspergillus caelatus]